METSDAPPANHVPPCLPEAQTAVSGPICQGRQMDGPDPKPTRGPMETWRELVQKAQKIPTMARMTLAIPGESINKTMGTMIFGLLTQGYCSSMAFTSSHVEKGYIGRGLSEMLRTRA